MDVLGLLWYVFYFLFCFFFPGVYFAFSFFGWGKGDEREGGGVRGERGMDRWREGRRRTREGDWVEERVLWFGLVWIGLDW